MIENILSQITIYLENKGYPIRFASDIELLNMLIDDLKNKEEAKNGK